MMASHEMAADPTRDASPDPTDFTVLPPNLPIPTDDGAADHLVGLRVPAISLASTFGGSATLAAFSGRTIVYAYPMAGEDTPPGWDLIPGARGCTPEACSFRDHHADLLAAGAVRVYGLSTHSGEVQRWLVERYHLPFEILSDAGFELTDALRLPTFEAGGRRLLKRHTLVIDDGVIGHVFYPIFPPDRHAGEVVAWLRGKSP
jgi:peroxiredoxin